MINSNTDTYYPSAKTLVSEHVASRLQREDATLYDYSEEAQRCAENFMGWADLASNPPYPIADIQKFADQAIAEGIETVILIAQGGSSQAPMTMSKFNKANGRVTFRVLDSDSPVRARQVLAAARPESTLVIVSSKSGGTIEPRMIFAVVREELAKTLSTDELVKHFVAITDPGSKLEQQAHDEGWRAVFSGKATVGGRFSALSVFGLVPAALAGINLEEFIAHACKAEAACSEDAIDNPAIGLASFLFDNYRNGRDKFAFLTQKRGRVLGLWIEQLVAESLGKIGQGILPYIEVDPLLLAHDPGDVTAIVYQPTTESWDERSNFDMGLSYVDAAIPRMTYDVDTVYDLAEHFVMWEYAIAMCGYLMRVCPFDQPDVASAKAVVLDILHDGMPEPDFVDSFACDVHMGEVEVRLSPEVRENPALDEEPTFLDALYSLFFSIEEGDYFAVNAFLPFVGDERKKALEDMRHAVAYHLGVSSCLEIGPRYLHSTGQLQKGGPNTGVFLLLSAGELKDIPIREEGAEAVSLGELSKAQAVGDYLTLADRGRRCVHLHLPDNTGATLRKLAEIIADLAYSARDDRDLAESLSDVLDDDDFLEVIRENLVDEQEDSFEIDEYEDEEGRTA